MGTATALKTYHHGDLRHAMLDAVAEVVRAQGVSRVSLRGIARRVGVSHAAATHHFGNKRGLLTAFATQGYVDLAEAVVTSINASGAGDGPAMLEASGRGYVRFALCDPERFAAMFDLNQLNSDDPEFVTARDSAYTLLAGAVERCRDEGFVAGSDIDVLAAAAWSLAHGLAALWISGRLGARLGTTDPEQLSDRVTRLFVNAMLRRR